MLRQIRVRYDALEDRLQLTLHSETQTHHLLLTRRVWMRARVALQRLLDLSAQLPAHLPQTVRESISAGHHQALAAQTPTANEPVETAGVPADAALVTEIRLGERKQPGLDAGQRSWVLEFRLHQRSEVRLVINDKTLHALVGALLLREQATDWGLPALPARSAVMTDDVKASLQ